MDPISEIIKDQSDDIPISDDQENEKNDSNTKEEKTINDIKMKDTQEKKLKENQERKYKDDQNGSSKKIEAQLQKINQKLETIASLIKKKETTTESKEAESNKIVKELEGVFDGKEMIASNTDRYKVPAKFIDNQKLVEGDLLKLKIRQNETYEYEQIGSVNRKRIVGSLNLDQTNNQWVVKTEAGRYKIINETTDLHQAEKGDKVVVIVPKNGKSTWATIENVFK